MCVIDTKSTLASVTTWCDALWSLLVTIISWSWGKLRNLQHNCAGDTKVYHKASELTYNGTPQRDNPVNVVLKVMWFLTTVK